MMQNKYCPRCKVTKQILEFYRDEGRKDKVYSYCKACSKQRAIIFRKKMHADGKGYKHFRNRKLIERYGITLVQYNEILKNQNGVCAVCKGTCTGRARNLHLDHCHTTGKVRGILCNYCNLAIGSARDNPKILRALATYLEGAPSLI